MYRDGLCERKFRDRSLQEIAEEEHRWDFATSTPGMTPIQALELVRGFAKALQESTPEAQREVVRRVFQRIAVTDDRVTTSTYTRSTPRLSGGIGDPNRTSFELQLNSDIAIWLANAPFGGPSAGGQRTVNGRRARVGR